MKGVIVLAIKDLITKRYGKEKWEEVLKKAGVEKEPIITVTSNVDDSTVMKVINAICSVLGISLAELGEAFGDYWVNEYSHTLYGVYYKIYLNAREFLLKMDEVHQVTTRHMIGADPPRFEYEWKDDKTLVMKYKSKRRLIDFMVGLIKGVGKFYKENLKVKKISDDKVEITFE
jgi:hypothetical protein